MWKIFRWNGRRFLIQNYSGNDKTKKYSLYEVHGFKDERYMVELSWSYGERVTAPTLQAMKFQVHLNHELMVDAGYWGLQLHKWYF